MKKKIFAMLMAMVLVLGMSSTTLAYTNSPTGNNQLTNSPTGDNEPTQIGKVDVTWSKTKPWTIEVQNVLDGGSYYRYSMIVYKDGIAITGDQLDVYVDTKVTFDISKYVVNNGVGEYVVEISVLDPKNGWKYVYEGKSIGKTYIKPEEQLAMTANLYIDIETGKCTFDQVEGAIGYDIWLWRTLAGKVVETTMFNNVYDNNLNDGQVEYTLGFISNLLKSYAERYKNSDISVIYGVRAISGDIDKVAYSEFEKQVLFENKLSKDDVKENFDSAFETVEENPYNAINTLVGVYKETLVEIMKEDAEFVKKVEKVEELLIEDYGDRYKGVTSKTSIVDANKVKVVGVAINGRNAGHMELAFADSENRVEVGSKYENAIALDIELVTLGIEKGDLEVPVVITMPIPTGVEKENLVILHYHDKKEPVIIVPTVNEDNTMTFVVDGFSTFVVANESVKDDSSTDDITPPTDSESGERKEIEVVWSATNPWYVDAESLAIGNDDYQYFVDILKDGKYVGNTGLWEDAGDKVVFDVSYIVAKYGNGKYTAEVSVVDMDARKTVAFGVSKVAVYEKPEKQLATVTNAKVDLEKDKLVFDQVEDAYAYYIWVWETHADIVGDYLFSQFYDEDTSDGKVECDLAGFADYVAYLKEECKNVDSNITFEIIALSKDINTVAASDGAKVVGYENKVSKETVKENFDKAFENVEENPSEAIIVLNGVSNETIIDMMQTDADFTAKVEKVDEAIMEELGDKYKGATSKTELVDASKVKVVGVAVNGRGAASVELTFAEAANKVEVDKKYENAIALDIELLVDGQAKEDLSVPVAITMPIPAGVEKENLVILHYHGDATEPVVIVPTINEDGTMTFYVGGFSTFVVANQVADDANKNDGNNGGTSSDPQTGDASGTTMMVSLLLLAVGVVLLMKRNAFAK